MRLIDADALIARWRAALLHMSKNKSGLHPVGFETAIEDVKARPTIEAEPVRHGRWIDAYCGKYANAKYICSCCGKRAHSDDWKWELSDFCPHCGAKMDGGGGDDQA